MSQLPKKYLLGSLLLAIIALIGLTGSVFLVLNQVNFQGYADTGFKPQNLRLTNLSPNSVTVSWTTERPSTGSVVYSLQEKMDSPLIALDERGGETNSFLHHVSLVNLQSETPYFFQILSGDRYFDNAGQPYVVTTASLSSGPPEPPFVIKGKAGDESLLYFSFADSTPLSVLTDQEGRFLFSLNNALKKDLQSAYPLQKGEKGELLFLDKNGATLQEVIIEEDLTVNKEGVQTQNASGQTLPEAQEGEQFFSFNTKLNQLRDFFRHLINP